MRDGWVKMQELLAGLQEGGEVGNHTVLCSHGRPKKVTASRM
ncbi:MAG: hypothetical protein QF412_05025 [Planctomycetota bacterium]|nr:hypothetical protein [Planctomycetota bacterium]